MIFYQILGALGMQNKLFFAVILGVAPIFGLFLTGCPSETYSNPELVEDRIPEKKQLDYRRIRCGDPEEAFRSPGRCFCDIHKNSSSRYIPLIIFSFSLIVRNVAKQ
jgi:hypothetical protein